MGGIVGVDFGTTNSVVAFLGEDGVVTTKWFKSETLELDVFRTLICFWSEGEGGRNALRHAAGPDAIQAYLDDPVESRLIMSMKTYLAQRSFVETKIFGRSFSLEQLIAVFLTALLGIDAAGCAVVVAGRPVRFAGDLADDEFGETRLRHAFALAGVPRVEVALEPAAAGYRFTRTLHAPTTVLVGDFGGGTSDFSLLRFTPGAEHPVVALAHGGVGIAGDTFDYRIIDNVVSPVLGKDDTYRIMGKDMPIPVEYYAGFARWHRLSMMRAPKILRDIENVARMSSNPAALRNLIQLIDDGAGYALYQTVSAVKAQLSRLDEAVLSFSHKDFAVSRVVRREEFEAWIGADLVRMDAVIDDVLRKAGIGDRDVDKVFLTGGTSFVPAVRRIFTRRFGPACVSAGGEFVSVAEGLALIGRDRRRPPS